MDAKISIESPDQIEAFLKQEETLLKNMVEKVLASGANVVVCQKGQAEHHGDRKQDLAASGSEHQLPHGHDFVQRELHADGKQQQRHADFSHCLNSRAVCDQVKSGRSHKDSRQQIGHNGRLPRPPQDNGDERGKPKQDEQVQQQVVMVH